MGRALGASGLLPVFGGTARLCVAADALQIGGYAALLHAVPLAADLSLVEAVLAFERVVDVVARRALVDEVSLALRRRGGADHAVLVLGPLVVNDVAGNRAVELAPRRLVGLLPAALNAAAGCLLRYEDFSAFSKRNTQVRSFQCTVTTSEWLIEDGMIVYRVAANRFLRGMVRGLVGTMLKVGRGRISVADFITIIEGKDSSLADFSVPPQGLFLVSVTYKE